MILEIFGFLSLSAMDILDILMVAAILYVLFRWIRGSSAMNIFIAIVILLIVRVIVGSLGMKLMTSLMDTLFDVGLLALIIIFQPEIRHFLMRLGGSSSWWRKVVGRLVDSRGSNVAEKAVEEIVEACRVMGEQKTGALIVIPGRDSLEYIIETGDRVDAMVSRRLILNLFFKNSPMHDGAMIIRGDRILAARCTLPITSRTDVPASFGMRHKAAIGISEESDATVVVVSEETGNISYVKDGRLRVIKDIYDLKLLLSPTLGKEEV
ncbi:MAG: diadenylate cyclase CdaA [Bacteroidales bacterium]|nr:diadenylate cyclase CdaA [Bacteroidales bacterium]